MTEYVIINYLMAIVYLFKFHRIYDWEVVLKF